MRTARGDRRGLGLRPFSPQVGEGAFTMNEAFRASLRVHIINASLHKLRARSRLWEALGTILVMLAAMGLIVALGMS